MIGKTNAQFLKELKPVQITKEGNVKVIDYDGSIIDIQTINNSNYSLPNVPIHTGLTFQGWACSQTITNNTIYITDNSILIGAVYTPTSTQSEFDIELTIPTGLSVTLNMNGTKDWGDGTSSTSGIHTYTNYGKYTIKCDGTTMSTISADCLFGQNSNSPNYYVTDVRLYNIQSITQYAFSYCYSLKTITIPNSVMTIATNAFYNCYGLETVVIPNSVATIATNTFYNCYALKYAIIPKDVTNITDNLFYNCFILQDLILPSGISSIGANSFYDCYCVKLYDFSNNTTIPTLSNTNAFTNIGDVCEIKVPSNLYDTWIAETNWSTYADYIIV